MGKYHNSRRHTRLYREIGRKGGEETMMLYLDFLLYIICKMYKEKVPELELLELFFK